MIGQNFVLSGIAVSALVGGGAVVGYNMTGDGNGGAACGNMADVMGGGMMHGQNAGMQAHVQEMHARCHGMMNSRSTSGSPPSSAATGPGAVEMRASQFQPSTLTIKVGESVTWINRDSYAHTVTSDAGGSPLDSPTLGPKESWTYTFSDPGTYAYHCTPHAYRDGSGEYRGMTGRIIVE